MNTQKFQEWNSKLVKGECPVCGKFYRRNILVFRHAGKYHEKEMEEYTAKLIEVNS